MRLSPRYYTDSLIICTLIGVFVQSSILIEPVAVGICI